jgi:hypothetical protein
VTKTFSNFSLLTLLLVTAMLAVPLRPAAAQAEDRWSGIGLRGMSDEDDTPAGEDAGQHGNMSDPGPAAGIAEVERRERRVDEDPYAPLGIRVGSFLFFPVLEMRGGYSDNVAQQSAEPRTGGYLRVSPELELRSDWSRHELRARAAASYRHDGAGNVEDRTMVDGEVSGRIDIRRDTSADLSVSYIREPESRDDPNVMAGVSRLRDVTRLRGEGSLTHQAGRIRLGLRGAELQTDYEDDVLPQDGRSFRTREGALRAALDLREGTAIFVETGVNRRDYRRPVDSSGIRRGSRGYEVLGGIELRLGGLIHGEIGVGYQKQTPDDGRLADIDGILVRGLLEWEPTALTTVTLSGSLTPEETVREPGASGARVQRADVAISHFFRRNLIATGRLGYTHSDYVGSSRRETSHRAGLGLEYLVSREVALLAEVGYERHRSNQPGGDYEENRIELGIRLRR